MADFCLSSSVLKSDEVMQADFPPPPVFIVQEEETVATAVWALPVNAVIHGSIRRYFPALAL